MQQAGKETNDYAKRALEYKASQVVTNKLHVSGKDKVLAVRRIAMLLNPKTVISRNAGGNLLFNTLENVKDIFGAPIDKLVSLKTGKRTTAFAPLSVGKAQLKGYWKGISEWGKDIKNGVDTSPTEHEMQVPAFKGKISGLPEKILNKAMQLGDRPFYQGAYEGRLAELKKLGYDTSNQDVQDWAKQYALERVFQNDSDMSKGVVQLRQGINKVSGGVGGNIVMPFAQTPANMFDKLLDYSPAGYVRAIRQIGKVGNDVFSQKKFVDTLSRSLTGTGILALGYALASKGILTGKQSTNAQVSAAEKLQGKQPYSIYINGKSYTYDWAGPAGSLLAASADAYNSGMKKTDFQTKILKGAEGAGNALFSQSYLTGLNDIFSYGNPSQGIINTVLGVPSQFAPTGGKQLAQVIDPYQRETYSPNMLKQAGNKVLAKIPGASMLLQPKIGANGQPQKNFQGRPLASNLFESFISPGYIGQNQQTPADKETYRLYQSTGNASVLPKDKISTSVTYGGKTYLMTDKEYTQYQKTYGQTAYNGLKNLIQDSVYASLPDTQPGATNDRSSEVQQIYKGAQEKATEEFLKKRGIHVQTTAEKKASNKLTSIQKSQSRKGKLLNTRIAQWTK